MGYLVQMAGLAVQNFVSAAVGIAVAIALVRGFARKRTERARQLLGRPGPRHCIRILLPISVVAAIVLIAGGAIQNFHLHDQTVQHARRRHRRRSPAVRSPARRPSRSSAPTAAASTTPTPRTRSRTRPRGRTGCEIFLLLVISFSLPRTFGRMVGDKRQGYAIVAVMARPGPRSASSLMTCFQVQHHGTVPTAVGAAMEGTEQRFGVAELGDLRRRDDADLDRRGRLASTTPTPASAAR